MKNLIVILSLSLAAAVSVAQTRIVELRSDKTVYAEGENPVLRADFLSKPDNTDFQFDILGTLNGTELAVDRVTDYQMFSQPRDLEPGTYTWEVTVVIQDARYARDLKESIAYYENLISTLEAQIAVETDPEALAALERRRDEAVQIKTAAESELNRIRKPVLAPLSLSFTVEAAE